MKSIGNGTMRFDVRADAGHRVRTSGKVRLAKPEGDMDWFAPTDEEKAKRAKIKAYFGPDKASGALPFFVLGATSAAFAIVLLRWDFPSEYLLVLATLSLVLLAIGVVLFYRKTLRAKDEDIDAWRKEDLDKIIAAVPDKADFDGGHLINRDDPIVIIGFLRFKKLRAAYAPRNGQRAKGWRFQVKAGKDGITRWTPLNLVVLHHTAKQLIAYQCDVDLVRGTAFNESVEEYFWKDLVSLQIEEETVSWAEMDPDLIRYWTGNLPKDHCMKYEALLAAKPKSIGPVPPDRRSILQLKANSGFGLKIILSDERFVEPASDPEQLEGSWEAGNEDAITRLRNLLREQNQPAVRKVLIR